MPTFVFTYRKGTGYTRTPQTHAAWVAWFDSMGDQLADRASPSWPTPSSATAARTAPARRLHPNPGRRPRGGDRPRQGLPAPRARGRRRGRRARRGPGGRGRGHLIPLLREAGREGPRDGTVRGLLALAGVTLVPFSLCAVTDPIQRKDFFHQTGSKYEYFAARFPQIRTRRDDMGVGATRSGPARAAAAASRAAGQGGRRPAAVPRTGAPARKRDRGGDPRRARSVLVHAQGDPPAAAPAPARDTASGPMTTAPGWPGRRARSGWRSPPRPARRSGSATRTACRRRTRPGSRWTPG